ncbi:putative glycoside hydrolase [Candidatus Parcubacteria bacterium]|nr:putative glycoside hydrolase [Candidatus Parcubacteria bacterium]
MVNGKEKEKDAKISTKPIFVGFFLMASLIVSYTSLPDFVSTKYKSNLDGEKIEVKEKLFVATHIPTPKAVKAIYMTACAASTPSFRDGLVQLVEDTEINTIVLNIKDETGKIAFDMENPDLQDAVANLSKGECKIQDIKGLIKDWHDRDIYVIGRLPVFQDLYLTKKRPDLAVKRESDGGVWRDLKGISWLDAGSKEVWDYVIAIGLESYNYGFDELNFDYIRFPSDGNMRDIYYPFSEEVVMADPDLGKAKVMRKFFSYLDKSFRDTGVVLSADLFGMVTTNSDDLNIGQILEYAVPYFDYIAPMVYPSHYPPNFNGWKNPNNYPYEVVKFSMGSAVEKLNNASTTPLKLRPWLQDFDYGGNYDIAEVKAQIQATYDVGLTSWMLWSASNKYTRGALLEE